MNGRIEFFNSKEVWKVGYNLENINEEYLSFRVVFSCNDIDPDEVTYGIYFDTANEQLESDDRIKIEKFEMKEIDNMIHYEIVFDVNIYLFYVNCVSNWSNCKADKLNGKWKSSFSLPIE